VKRAELRAIKIVGAGQFGKVFLAIQTTPQGTVGLSCAQDYI
jgi:hypothetical protein